MRFRQLLHIANPVVLLSGILLIFSSVYTCERIEPESMLIMTTGSVETLGDSHYRLTGTIVNIGERNIVQHGFCWSESNEPTISGQVINLGIRRTNGIFTSTISGLEGNTIYYVRAFVTNGDGTDYGNEEWFITGPDAGSSYTINDTLYTIDSEMFWYQSGMGGDPYIGLLTSVDGQDNPDLLRLYPQDGYTSLPGIYSWDNELTDGSFDLGYTANYAGMSYAWMAIGKSGSGDLTITEVVPGEYNFTGEFVLSMGYYDFGAGGTFVETGTANLSLNYTGEVLPL